MAFTVKTLCTLLDLFIFIIAFVLDALLLESKKFEISLKKLSAISLKVHTNHHPSITPCEE
jgi:hypothetical protein